MRYEELQGVKIPKVGFGTWSMGGGTRAHLREDGAALAALRSALELGYRHFDTAEAYANGHTEELLGRAIRDALVDRAILFLTSKVGAENLSSQGVMQTCARRLRRLGTEYLDLYLIHWPNPSVPLEQGNLRVRPELPEIAEKRSVTPHQVAIAWLCSQQRIITIPMSADPSHQRANLEAADMVLSVEEIAAIAAWGLPAR